MAAETIVVAAVVAVVFVVLIVVMWNGHVELLSGFPQDAATLSEADRKSMGRGIAILLAFLMLVALALVLLLPMAQR